MKKSIFTRTIAFVVLVVAFGAINSSAQFTKLLDFAGTSNGNAPSGDLYFDGTFLYGTTTSGGTNNIGTIFKIMPDGTGYVKLLDFAGTTNGSSPFGSLISDGTFLYGMTKLGGSQSMGVVFKIKTDGTGYTKLLDFTFAANGSNPLGSLFSDGIFLYGTTYGGGANSFGTIFKIKPDGTNFSKLLDFADDQNGKYPQGSLMSDGTYLYGTTTGGGTNNMGVVFKIKKDGTGYAKLIDFTGMSNGSTPLSSLLFDGMYLYGSTAFGGSGSSGTIFKVKPDGTGYVKLHDFIGFPNGANPWGTLIMEGTYLYGMTRNNGAYNGTIFKIMPDGTGYVDLYDFTDINNGAFPQGSLTFNGLSFFGTAYTGGVNSDGTIFKYDMITGIDDISNNSSITIYPNPTNGNFTIRIDGEHAVKPELEIYNTVGEKIYSNSKVHTQASNEINLSEFSKGIYFAKVYDNEKVYVRKIIVE